MNFYLNFILLLFLSGCGSISIKREFESLKNSVERRLDSSIQNALCPCEYITTISHELQSGLSREKAIGIALKNNPDLQASFEELGIAKADLVQAGLYSNPQLDAVFKRPLEPGDRMNFEIGPRWKLSDLWIVPLSRNVAQAQVETATAHILQVVLNVIRDVNFAYTDYLAQGVLVVSLKRTKKILKEMSDTYKYYFKYGYNTELQVLESKIAYEKIRSDLLVAKAELKSYLLELKRLMGIDPSMEPIVLSGSLDEEVTLVSRDKLEEYALSNHPGLIISNVLIQKFKDLAALEKGKVLDDVNIGLQYEQDFEDARGFGPYFNLSIPLFNQNQGNIAKAYFLLNQEKKILRAKELLIIQDLRMHYNKILAYDQACEIYEQNILNLRKRASDWAAHYYKQMRITYFVPLEVVLRAQEETRSRIMLQKNKLHAYADLERVVSKKINNLAV